MTYEAPRRVLLLQGPASRFPSYLGQALSISGAEVHRILLCPGDWLFWRGRPGTVHFRGRVEEWPDFVDAYARRHAVTDLACLGDGRQWHRDAIDRLRPRGVRIHLMEQGYLRPGWLTLEPDGTGGTSTFPRNWRDISALSGGACDEPDPAGSGSFTNYAAMDVAFNLANLLIGRISHPHYRTHALDGSVREWSGWIGKALGWPARRHRVAQALTRVRDHVGPVFVFALQLETDFQIRLHGPAEGLRGALCRAIGNFAEHAPEDALLVVKSHPLDNGWAGWRRIVRTASDKAGVAERVLLLEGGSFELLLDHLAGVVTVNSTAGLSALRRGVPVVALGTAIYDLEGLTHSGTLSTFWHDPSVPDAGRVALLVGALKNAIQIRGSFDGPDARPGAEAMASRILSDQSAFSRIAATAPSDCRETASSAVI